MREGATTRGLLLPSGREIVAFRGERGSYNDQADGRKGHLLDRVAIATSIRTGVRRILATDFCLAPVGQERKVTVWERRPRRDIGCCNRGEDAAPTSVFED